MFSHEPHHRCIGALNSTRPTVNFSVTLLLNQLVRETVVSARYGCLHKYKRTTINIFGAVFVRTPTKAVRTNCGRSILPLDEPASASKSARILRRTRCRMSRWYSCHQTARMWIGESQRVPRNQSHASAACVRGVQFWQLGAHCDEREALDLTEESVERNCLRLLFASCRGGGGRHRGLSVSERRDRFSPKPLHGSTVFTRCSGSLVVGTGNL
eukprot:SAG11_NODE_5622_length_1505_cov_1.290896_2_plen_213_part_00